MVIKNKWTNLFMNFIISDQLSALSTAWDAGRDAIHHPGETVTSVTHRPGTVGNAAYLRQQQQQLLHLLQFLLPQQLLL